MLQLCDTIPHYHKHENVAINGEVKMKINKCINKGVSIHVEINKCENKHRNELMWK